MELQPEQTQHPRPGEVIVVRERNISVAEIQALGGEAHPSKLPEPGFLRNHLKYVAPDRLDPMSDAELDEICKAPLYHAKLGAIIAARG